MQETLAPSSPAVANELNNLLQIISGTSSMIENIWEGSAGSEKYFAMLRASIERAERITAQLVEQAGGIDQKVLLHPELAAFAKKPAPPVAPSPCKERILLVDDDAMSLALLEKVLSDADFEVVTTSSGFECLDVFHNHVADFQLVLLDYAMPFMNGDEIFRRLRRMSADVPIVLTTGFIDEKQLETLIAEGLAGFIRKPHSPSETVAYLRKVIESARSARGAHKARGILAAV